MSACILSVSQLAHEFSGQTLFSQLSFQLFEGARTGLLGANGSGKTTLLRLLAGQVELQQGQIERRVRPLYLEQSGQAPDAETLAFEALLAFRPELPPLWRALHEQEYQMSDPVAYAEQVAHFADLDGYRYQAQAESMAESFGFVTCDLFRPLASFSGGERRLLNLAAIFAAEPELLLLDEPTHYLDQSGLEYLLAALKQTSAAVLLVSHDRWFLDQTVDQVLLLERGETRLYKGNYTTFSATYAAENLERERQKAKLDREIAQLQEVRRHYKVWGNQREKIKHACADSGFESARAARLQSQSLQAQKRLNDRIERLQAVRPWVEKSYQLAWQSSVSSAQLGLYVKNLVLPYGCLQPLSFQLNLGQKWALTGSNGSGKSTLIRALIGEVAPLQGLVGWGQSVQYGYLPQFLPESCSQQDVSSFFPAFQWGEARRILGALKLKGEFFHQPLALLSQGQQRKVMLARLILMAPQVLILDEPANHLDYEAIEMLEALLLDFPGALLLVSHDRRLREQVTDAEICLD
ncbi:MAG: ABC-F family ATP-binding cassette domain-containing protein [Candidatus Sericytochromatia bacterium]